MRETIRRRRAALEDAIGGQLPETGPFDRFRQELRSIGRPRIRGQVFLAMIDGFADDGTLEEVVPVATALELAALQTRVHRSAFDRDRSTAELTTDILRGDLLESKAFEVMTGVSDRPSRVRRCFAVLVRATRRVQEGHAIRHGSAESSPDREGERDRRLGALTGAGAEIAAILADRDGSRPAIARDGSRFGRYVERRAGESDDPRTDADADPDDDVRVVAPLADHCPERTRPRVRRQLRALLEDHVEAESTDSLA